MNVTIAKGEPPNVLFAIRAHVWALRWHVRDSENKLKRPWQVIAEELAGERDAQRVRDLSSELNEALDAQAIPRAAKVTPTAARRMPPKSVKPQPK
jgi:hypothetical protein